jgi:hypothetical protein
MSSPPNPRLQRTSVRPAGARSPLSRKSLGVGSEALQRWPAAHPVQVQEIGAVDRYANPNRGSDLGG